MTRLLLAWFVIGASALARAPLPVAEGNPLPLRVIVRPFSPIHAEGKKGATILKENVEPFTIFYVYGKAEGWVEVGADKRGQVLGWMQAEDVIEWKQTLSLTYAHPEGRKPALMFERRAQAEALVDLPEAERVAAVRALYETIDSGKVPADFPVLSVEPKRALDVKEKFYLLPILEHAPVEIGGREGRLLQIAAATLAAQGRGATTVRDAEFMSAATRPTDFSSGKLRELKIDVVFVMDLTKSMKPFLDATFTVVKSLSTQMSSLPQFKERMRFGFWGYRDSTTIKGMEFVTKNFTPELRAVGPFLDTLASVRVTDADSADFEEDVFSGMHDAITKTAWTPGALRLVILVGDAPSHPLGHAWNASGKSERELRALADERRVSIFALHLKDPAHAAYHETAERQFQALSKNRGISEGDASYYAVESSDVAAFAASSTALLKTLARTLAYAQSGVNAPVADASVEGLSGRMMRAALVDWLGARDGAEPPRDITAWVSDKDLIEPSVPAFIVNLLLTKNELDAMVTMLETTLEAGARGSVSGGDFFQELQAIATSAVVAPEQIKSARTLADTGLLPVFLRGLPYRSEVMDLTSELWAGWSQDRQEKFLRDVRAKIEFYKALHDSPDLWTKLNDGADEDEKVVPVPLEFLP